ncbi:hypothetical protein X798_05994 [Onchocerca flexuosa]|uniref:Chitin-binding type-2 domain-containing protein n=1 Tax=Onchocerca flexuosa TaxID=387005 RepID=A0A238BR09_9BILA|nr:hypothetical protein X798_05994 [Onchocerca flexuosa]
MEFNAGYSSLLILIIINLSYVLHSQQLTPIIGESGKGIWVVKSRTLSTTASTTSQTSTSPAVFVTASVSVEDKQQSQQFSKSDSIICVQDKSARNGGPCSVSSICLQQEQGQMSSNYLQCDQNTNQWIKKSCLDGRIFSFEHQTCIASLISTSTQNRVATLLRIFFWLIQIEIGESVCKRKYVRIHSSRQEFVVAKGELFGKRNAKAIISNRIESVMKWNDTKHRIEVPFAKKWTISL